MRSITLSVGLIFGAVLLAFGLPVSSGQYESIRLLLIILIILLSVNWIVSAKNS
jgi:uncharacterized membrane protein YccC